MGDVQPSADGDPRQVGPYPVTGRIGSGGMGRVYLAETPDGQRVAVKVVRPDFADDTVFRRRFRREVAAAQRVHGRFTAAVVDADVDDDRPWLATEYVPGPSLREAVVEQGRWRRTRCCCWPPGWPRHCVRSTTPGWCTGTSSRRTCCSPTTVPG